MKYAMPLAALLICAGTGTTLRAADEPEIKDGNHKVVLKTNIGDVELELFENLKPNTVANFISFH